MSAKACTRCGGVIVFGKDRETGRIIPLSVGSNNVYRVVKGNIVEPDPKALIRHVCVVEKPPVPSPERDFTEPQSQE
jgi:hypothetical protein